MPDKNVASPQNSPPPSSKFNWKKVMLISFIVIILLAVLFYGFIMLSVYIDKSKLPGQEIKSTPASQATPSAQKDETANWKNYTNSENKYSIKYPPTYKLVPLETPERGSVSFLSKDYKLKDSNLLVISNGVNIMVSIGGPGVYKNLDEYESSLIEETKKYDKKLINLAGETWRSFDYQGLQSGRSRITFVIKDRRLYVLSFDSTAEDHNSGIEIYNLILSTFKFLD
ncbi:MAG: hypothetical protein A2Z42_02255 [Candidatus Woykebacteria bacterium RBG_19FT_COMBO_43_10]|uniref:PsbP C-terminal domain-containing protein n=1 Tax=Candidatus Woykebacteria bacterium RBG_19FT_COMBO_43_10 TaxID=1802598 RepID=A0A1G1WJJ4_9BACT|nr:MAG: hypothetical protein A2Z42_02255 [Candidatus Woykebacteria bacterium RBG_19FT_COMBO_43_10]